MTPSNPIIADDLNPEERAEYESLSQTDRENYLGLQNHYAAMFEQPEENTEALTDAIDKIDREVEEEVPIEFETNVRLKPSEVGFWADDEPDEMGQMEDADDEYDESMITAVAESELELHREIREYTRIAAWDMPLLSSMTTATSNRYRADLHRICSTFRAPCHQPRPAFSVYDLHGRNTSGREESRHGFHYERCTKGS